MFGNGGEDISGILDDPKVQDKAYWIGNVANATCPVTSSKGHQLYLLFQHQLFDLWKTGNSSSVILGSLC